MSASMVSTSVGAGDGAGGLVGKCVGNSSWAPTNETTAEEEPTDAPKNWKGFPIDRHKKTIPTKRRVRRGKENVEFMVRGRLR